MAGVVAIPLCLSLSMSFCFAGRAIAAEEAPTVAGLPADESARLSRGETITREQTIDAGERRYVGGVTYTIVDAPPEEIASLLEDVHTYRRVLPKTKQALLVGENGPDFFVELRQGNAMMEAKYTLRARKDPAHHQVRFWLDRSRPHGIDDAWGFFRYEALPARGGGERDGQPGTQRTLLTYGILVDVGPGIVRELFEERLRRLMLSVPQLVQRYVADRTRDREAREERDREAFLAPN